VLAGPKAAARSCGQTRPWRIAEVFLFDAAELAARQVARGVKAGTAAGVPGALWESARICPPAGDAPQQAARLRLFDG